MPAELLHGGGHVAARLPLALQHQRLLTAGLHGRHGRSRRGLSSPSRSPPAGPRRPRVRKEAAGARTPQRGRGHSRNGQEAPHRGTPEAKGPPPAQPIAAVPSEPPTNQRREKTKCVRRRRGRAQRFRAHFCPHPPGSRSRVAGAILWGQRWDRRMLRLGNLLSSQLGSIHGGLRVLTQVAAATVAECELLYAQLLPFASRKHTHLAGHKTQPQPSTRSVVPTVRQCNILSVRRRRTEAAVGNKQTRIECCICCTKLLWHRTEIGFPGKFALAQGDTTLKLNGYKRLHKTCPINTKLLP